MFYADTLAAPSVLEGVRRFERNFGAAYGPRHALCSSPARATRSNPAASPRAAEASS